MTELVGTLKKGSWLSEHATIDERFVMPWVRQTIQEIPNGAKVRITIYHEKSTSAETERAEPPQAV